MLAKMYERGTKMTLPLSHYFFSQKKLLTVPKATHYLIVHGNNEVESHGSLAVWYKMFN